MARSTLYRVRTQLELPLPPPKKRGPRTAYSDADLLREIRNVLAESPFNGEGHRKAWARLRGKGIRTSKRRVLRIMRENGLLAPARPSRVLGPRVHDGTIVTDAPDQMWGAPMRPASRHSKKARSRSSRQWIIALQSAWVSMRPGEPRVSRHSSQFGKASVSGSAPTPRRSPEASLFAMTTEASTSATTSRMSCASSASPRALRSFALRKGTAALSDSSGL